MRSRLDKRAAPVQRSLRAVDIDRPHATHSQAARKICRPTTQSLWAWFITSTRARAARLIHKTAKSPNSTNQGHALSIQGSQLLVLVPEALLQVSHLRLELLDLSAIARSSEDDEGQGNDDVPDVGLTALVGDNLNCGACVGCRHVTQRLGVCTRKSA